MTDPTISLSQARTQAWYNLAAAFVAFFFMMGMPTLLLPTLYPMIMEDMGWSRGQVTSFASFKFLAGAISAFFVGVAIDKVGINRVAIITAVITAGGLSAFYFVDSLAIYYTVGFILGVGSMSTSITMKVLISRWFSARQGFAIGIAMIGSGVAGVLTPIAGQYLSEMLGWKLTIVIFSVGVWVLFIPLYLYAATGSPEDYGLTAEEIDPVKSDNKTEKEVRVDLPDQPEFSEIFRCKSFWLLMVGNMLIGFVEQGVNQNTKIFLEIEIGLGGTLAAAGLSMIALTSNIGKVFFGWIFDKFSVRGVAICWITIAIGIATALPVTGMLTLVIFAVFRGSSHGGILIDIPVMAKHCFGFKAMSKAISVLYAGYMIGAAAGPPFVGFMADATGSYVQPLLFTIIMSLVAAALIWKVEPKFWQGNLAKK